MEFSLGSIKCKILTSCQKLLSSFLSQYTQCLCDTNIYFVLFCVCVFTYFLFQFLHSPNLSFDMAGSLTSTPSHAVAATITSSGAASILPSASSTPLVSIKQQQQQGSLLTTPTLGSDMSAHSTPKIQKFSPERPSRGGAGEAPRTPTPFKRALLEVYRGREPLSNTPQTPTKRVEDIDEIIKKDMQNYSEMSFNHSGDLQVRIFSNFVSQKKKYCTFQNSLFFYCQCTADQFV